MIYKRGGAETTEAGWQSPSNIALIKYWGKRGRQLPNNPSLSITLSKAVTTTVLRYRYSDNGLKVSFLFEGQKNIKFESKIRTYLENIREELHYIPKADLLIESSNSFPHSAGIASSASFMSSLALCLCSIDEQLNGREIDDSEFFKKASFLARLGSGSACRSVYGGFVLWGKHEEAYGSSDLFAIPIRENIHEKFRNYCDTILIVDSSPKKVSSSQGHVLMDGHPYAEARYRQAKENLDEILKAIETGNEEKFIELVELEAMSLHALMMSSTPFYSLLKENTHEIIRRIQDFRKENKLNICFTLDAGPNVHLLYPEYLKGDVEIFIREQVAVLCENGKYLTDEVGQGPVNMSK